MLMNNLAQFNNADFHKLGIENLSIDTFTSKELAKHRVLIINANNYSQAIHSEFLENLRFLNIDFTNSVNQLIELTNQHRYLVILLTVLSVTQNISAICKIIRKYYKNKMVMILAAFYYMNETTYDLSISCGMNGLINKPFFFNKYKKALYFYLSKII